MIHVSLIGETHQRLLTAQGSGHADRAFDGFALAEHRIHISSSMTRNARTIANEAIALTPVERAEVAVAILDSLPTPTLSDDEVRVLLKQRSADLASGKDRGLSFEEVVGEPL